MTNDDPELTEEAKRQIEEVREAYERGEGIPIGEAFKALGMDTKGLDTKEDREGDTP